MEDPKKSRNFWLGNALLGLALVILLFMERLWQIMGVGAMVLWVVVAAIGAYFLMKDRDRAD